LLENKEVQTLVNLGLTVLQAKVYLALSKLGASTGRITAKQAQVASQDVYRILAELQEKGLLEKLIAKPTIYKATPITIGLSILLKNKKQEYNATEKQVKKMSDDLGETINQNAFPGNLQFTVVSESTLIKKKHERLADDAKKSIDIMVPVKMNMKMVLFVWPYIARALKRGVKIRLITQRDDAESASTNMQLLENQPFFEQRYLPEASFPVEMHIFDKQEVTFSLSEKPIPILQTNNHNSVLVSEACFESMWKQAKLIKTAQP